MAGCGIKRLLALSCPDQRQCFSSFLKLWLAIGVVLFPSSVALAQRPAAAQPTPTPTVQPTPLPQETPFSTPSLPVSPALPASAPSAAPSPSASLGGAPLQPQLLTLDEALRLANALASNFQQARLNEQIAAEDVRQAQAAFLPHLSAPLSYLYTSPALGVPTGTPRAPSFIANNAISEYQAYVNVAGDIDIAGRLRATLAKNRALLEAAYAGTEVARRALVQAVIETYYGLALATAQRGAAEQNLLAAEEFERITSLLLSGGEVASVDLTRAQLQTIGRRDELERAKANEAVAAGSLRILVGYDFTRPISTTDLALAAPGDAEFQQFKASNISGRPEFVQFEAQVRAAKQEVKVARADRLPQLSYSILGGFDSDSLRSPRLKEHTGVSGAISLTIPIFDWGASRSRERQARLREQIAENERTIALRGFTEQFYSAQAQLTSAAVRIRLAGTGVTQGQVNLDASIARYRAGEAQIIEVTDALTTLAAQRLALYQAIFDYQVALAHLRQAAGQ
jgi:outer membrane protein